MRAGRAARNVAIGAAAALGTLYAWEAARYKRTSGMGFDLADPPAPGTAEFAELLEAMTGAPVRSGNRVTVLKNGCRIFPAMLDAIRSAEDTIDFATYVYWTGGIAEEIADALRDRARAGVEVNLLLDAVGAAKMNRDLLRSLEESGANVVWFRPPHWYTIDKMNNRTHRKVLIVDGRVGFTGGVGIAEEWEGDCETPQRWRDTHLRIEGPAVTDLLGGFMENWSEAAHRILTGRRMERLAAMEEGVPIHVIRSSPEKGSTEAEQLFYVAIAGARERLWITSAYFAPRRAFLDALRDAVARGVDVRVVVNGPHTDKQVVRRAGRRSYGELLDAGVRLYEYQRTLLHAKTLVADGRWCSVGSINMDNRSMSLNDELNASVWDPEIAATLEQHFEDDLADSEEITPDRWEGRPVRERVFETASGLVKREL